VHCFGTLFLINFAVSVVTGIVEEFQFGINWSAHLDPENRRALTASAMVAGATLAAARAFWTSAAQYGVSIAGGLHHAMARNASGFCIYNDPAIAMAWLLGQGAARSGSPTST
jgi:acetoin utilization deacetylase AcuC-like enzyme